MNRHTVAVIGAVVLLVILAVLLWGRPCRVEEPVPDTEPDQIAPDEPPAPVAIDPDKPVMRFRLPVYNGRWAFASSVKKRA